MMQTINTAMFIVFVSDNKFKKQPTYENQACCARGQVISQLMFITRDSYFVLNIEVSQIIVNRNCAQINISHSHLSTSPSE